MAGALHLRLGDVVLPLLDVYKRQIQRRGLAGTIDYIDLTDVSAPVMSIDGRFTVLFGSEETIDYQFGKLVSAVSQLTSADRGTLDISAAGEGVTFSPF